MAKRTKGSCRFDDYYKVQVWDAAALAWRDIQKGFQSAAEAFNSAPDGAQFRIVTVTDRGRVFGDPERRGEASIARRCDFHPDELNGELAGHE